MEIYLDTGSGGNDGFKPVTHIGGGKTGLKKKQSTLSTVTLHGRGLKNGLTVRVDHNPEATLNPKRLWTGFTRKAADDETSCEVVLTQWMAFGEKEDKDRDDDITVSVTATDTTTVPHTPSNTITPTVASTSAP